MDHIIMDLSYGSYCYGFRNSWHPIWLRWNMLCGMTSKNLKLWYYVVSKLKIVIYDNSKCLKLKIVWEKCSLVVCICIQIQMTYMHTSRGSYSHPFGNLVQFTFEVGFIANLSVVIYHQKGGDWKDIFIIPVFCVLVNNTNDGLTGAKYLQSLQI